MNDSADIKLADARLSEALSQLEGAVRPLMSRINQLEKMAKEAESFDEDRADLARQLDQSEARAADFQTREADFNAREAAFQSREAEFQSREEQISELAAQTRQELNSVIQQVRDALGQG